MSADKTQTTTDGALIPDQTASGDPWHDDTERARYFDAENKRASDPAAPSTSRDKIMEISGSDRTRLFVSWTDSYGTPWRQEPISIPDGYRAEIYLVKEEHPKNPRVSPVGQ